MESTSTPRISATLMDSYVGQNVIIVGKVVQLRGDTAFLEADGQVQANLNRDCHLMVGNGAQIIGKVNPDLSIKVLNAIDLGNNVANDTAFAVSPVSTASIVSTSSWSSRVITPPTNQLAQLSIQERPRSPQLTSQQSNIDSTQPTQSTQFSTQPTQYSTQNTQDTQDTQYTTYTEYTQEATSHQRRGRQKSSPRPIKFQPPPEQLISPTPLNKPPASTAKSQRISTPPRIPTSPPPAAKPSPPPIASPSPPPIANPSPPRIPSPSPSYLPTLPFTLPFSIPWPTAPVPAAVSTAPNPAT
ncbi:hypothetical protein ABKA04_001831 [Annulohypoxylon sp. FPYF3050]